MEFDSFRLNDAWYLDDEKSFDLTATYDGYAVNYIDDENPGQDVSIERVYSDFSSDFGVLTPLGSYTSPQIVANLLPTNDDLFIVYGNRDDNTLDALVIDENDIFSATLLVIDPATVPNGLRVDDAIVLNNGNFATLFWNDGANYVSIISADGTLLNEAFVASNNSNANSEVARDIAGLAEGGYVAVGEGGSVFQEIFARIYDNTGSFVSQIIPIEISGYRVDNPRVAALPDGGFVVMFEADGYRAQVFNADGSSAGPSVVVGDGGFFQSSPELSVTADGRIVFVWNGEEGPGLNTEIFSSIWDPRGEVIDPDDYGQFRTNFLATDTITTGIDGSIVLEGEIGDNILGQGGDDTIYTSGSGDFWGGGGDDLFILSATFPLLGDFRYINGETGVDTLDTRAVFGDYNIDLETGAASYPGAPFTPNEEFLNIENIITGAGDDTITGSALRNQITTNDGDDTVFAGDGDDFINGDTGNDTLNGEGGNDRLFGGDGGDVLNGGAGNDRLEGNRGHDTLEGGLGDDTLNGGEGNDFIEGGDGADTVFGQSGDDTIDGGAGNDDLFGEGGNDVISGGLGYDTISGSGGNDIINGNGGNDTAFGGEGNDTVRGGSGNDRLLGNGGNDFIDGEDGDDTLAGEGGADTVFGGGGNDVLGGGGGNDVLNGGNGNDRLFGGSNDDRLLGGAGDDFMQGNQQNDDLFGQSGNDRLFGGDGGDFLDGGSGNDRLEGNQGRDTLVGGLGADVLLGGTFGDTFVFSDVADSNLVTMDLIVGVDGIGVALGDVFDVSGIDADTTVAGNQAFTFLGLQSAASALSFGAGALWLENAGGPTMLFGNVDNDAVIEFAVRIDDGGAITAADYTLGDFIV